MPPRQRALTIVLSFPAPRTNWSCAARMALRADRPPAVRARGNRAEYDDLRAATRAFGTAIRRSESAGICVLSVRRRMLCPSRWVIPGLAAGITGWSADQRCRRQPVFGPRAGARADLTAPVRGAGATAGRAAAANCEAEAPGSVTPRFSRAPL